MNKKVKILVVCIILFKCFFSSFASVDISWDDNLEKISLDEFLSWDYGKQNFTMQTLVEPHNGEYEGISMINVFNKLNIDFDGYKTVIFKSGDGAQIEKNMNLVVKNDYINNLGEKDLEMMIVWSKDGHKLVLDRSDGKYNKEIENDGGPIRLMVGQIKENERNSLFCLKDLRGIVLKRNELVFSDLEVKHNWAKDAINSLVDMGIINGKSEKKFAPDDLLKRSEFSKMLCLAFLQRNDEDLNLEFKDVKNTDWHYKYMAKLYKQNFIKGDGEGKLFPNQNITREQAILMIYRIANSKEKSENKSLLNFKDYSKLSKEGKLAFIWADENNILDNIFIKYILPDKEITRSEIAVLLYRAMRLNK